MGLCVGLFIIGILCTLSIWVTSEKNRRTLDRYLHCQIPHVSKDIKVDRVGRAVNIPDHPENLFLTVHDKSN